MINFPCMSCSEPLSVPADLAGGDIQCPACGTLCSVPLVSDLPNLHADGTHHLAPDVGREDPDRLQRLAAAFGRARVDDDGVLIDNRTMPDAIDLAPMPPPPRVKPRYDPETGELIAAIPIKRAAPLAAIPVGPTGSAGPPSVGYATPGMTESTRAGSVWLELFGPTNLFVMSVVGAVHVLGALLDWLVYYILVVAYAAGGPALPSWPFNLFFWMVVAHYANVVSETGPEGQDELPRPMRDFGLGEDFLGPLVRTLVAFAAAYAPALLALSAAEQSPAARPVAAAMLLLGGLLFPATLLAAGGTNSLSNLRPDRVLNVIRWSGGTYWVLAAVTTVTVPVYLFAVTRADMVSPMLVDTAAAGALWDLGWTPLVRLPLGVLAVYAFHGVCWRLGQLYRQHHLAYGFAWEVHEVERLAERQRRQAEREAAARRRRATGV